MKNKYKKPFLAVVSAAVAATLFAGCADKSSGKKPTPPPEPPCTHEHVTPHVESAPTCTDDGHTIYVCDSCHETVDETTEPANGHDYTYAETTGLCKTCEQKICSPGMTYELNADESGYIISDPDHNCGTDVVIPEYHEGKPVVEIKGDAFNARTYIKSISVPKTIKTIGVGAFNGCNGLENVYYNAECADDFRGINWVFYYSGTAPELSVTIGKAVKRIPARLFYPHNANSGVIPHIESLTFETGCKVESIGDYAFYKTGMTAISLPDSVTEVGEHVFESSAVETVSLGKGIKKIGAHAFDYCNGLENIDFSGAPLERLESSVFRNCGQLGSVTLPDTLRYIGDKAFYNCASLEAITFGGAESIGEEAFRDCVSLESVTLPRSLETIGKSAFEGCSGLTSITVESESINALSAGNRVFYGAGASAGVTVKIGSSVKSLPDRLFYSTADTESNIKISLLSIAVGLESIGENAFRGVDIGGTEYAGTQQQYAEITVGAGNGAIGTPTYEAEVA